MLSWLLSVGSLMTPVLAQPEALVQGETTLVEVQVVAAVLDALHEAASIADEQSYFELFSPSAVFLGTAGSERWTVEEFRAFAHPYFARGQGWTYTARPGNRHIFITTDGSVAWFDEVLDNQTYGECRGTGVLRRIDGAWKFEQYNLTLPIPNAIAMEVVDKIRHHNEAALGDSRD